MAFGDSLIWLKINNESFLIKLTNEDSIFYYATLASSTVFDSINGNGSINFEPKCMDFVIKTASNQIQLCKYFPIEIIAWWIIALKQSINDWGGTSSTYYGIFIATKLSSMQMSIFDISSSLKTMEIYTEIFNFQF